MIISIDGKKYRINAAYTDALKNVCMDQIREVREMSLGINSDKMFITYLLVLNSITRGMIKMLDEEMLHQFVLEIENDSE